MPHINIIESIANFFINALLSTRIIPKAIYIENDLCYSISEFVKTYNLKEIRMYSTVQPFIHGDTQSEYDTLYQTTKTSLFNLLDSPVKFAQHIG